MQSLGIHYRTWLARLALAVTFTAANPGNANAQTSQVSSGTVKSFSVNAASTFSVNATATSSPGVRATSEAQAILLENKILTGVDCSGSNCSATFNRLDTSQDISVKGAASSQQIVLDPKSVFKSSVDTGQTDNKGQQNTGNASAGFSAQSTLTVSEQESQFTNTLVTTF